MIVDNPAVGFARFVLTWSAPALLVAIASAQTTTGNESSSKESTFAESSGKEIYFAHGCHGCHGYTGETGARVLIGSGILSSEQTFIAFLRLRAEQNPLTPSVQMPNYSQAGLSDADARKLYAYVRSFKSDAPPVDKIPAFKAILDAASRP